MGYQTYAGYKREKHRGLSPRFNIFVILKYNSNKFCLLIDNNKKIISMSASLLWRHRSHDLSAKKVHKVKNCIAFSPASFKVLTKRPLLPEGG